MKKIKKQKEPYLKIPAHILNLTQIGLREKVLLAHIYSFGTKGCWQSNETLAQILMVSAPTISRWLRRIKRFVYVRHPHGYSRTLWARSHPDVIETVRIKSAQGPNQNCGSDRIKSAILVNQKCVATNNNTITEDNYRTTASPSPPPPRPASATLDWRRQQAAADLEKFKKHFGRVPKLKPLSPQQFDKRRSQQLAALRARQNI
ncbi:MAG: hypothetical protein ACE5NM_00880 [Sedimentisphaerales bacterium]